MEGKCISSDNKENIVLSPYAGGGDGRKFHEDKIPSSGNRTSTPVFRKKMLGLVLLPSKCDLVSLKCKEKSKTKKTCDDENEANSSKKNGEHPQSEKPSEKTTTNSQLESTVQSLDSSSSGFFSVNCTSPIEKTNTQNREKYATSNDEEVLDWREVLEKFKEHIKNSNSRISEENENTEKVVKQEIETSCYSNKLKEIQPLSSSMSICDNILKKDFERLMIENYDSQSEKIDVKEVEPIYNANMENVGTDIKNISRKTGEKDDAEFSHSEELSEKVRTKLQKGTFTHCESTIQTVYSLPASSIIGRESPKRKMNDQNSDQYVSRCCEEKVLFCSEFSDKSSKYLENGLEEDQRTPKENIEKAKQQEIKAAHHKKKLIGIQQKPCHDDFEPKSEKTDAEKVEKISNSKPNSMNAVSASENFSRIFKISKQMRMGKKVVSKNGTAPVKELSDLGTYEDFKKYLLRRANRLKCNFMRNVDDVDNYENFKMGIIAKNCQIRE